MFVLPLVLLKYYLHLDPVTPLHQLCYITYDGLLKFYVWSVGFLLYICILIFKALLDLFSFIFFKKNVSVHDLINYLLLIKVSLSVYTVYIYSIYTYIYTHVFNKCINFLSVLFHNNIWAFESSCLLQRVYENIESVDYHWVVTEVPVLLTSLQGTIRRNRKRVSGKVSGRRKTVVWKVLMMVVEDKRLWV